MSTAESSPAFLDWNGRGGDSSNKDSSRESTNRQVAAVSDRKRRWTRAERRERDSERALEQQQQWQQQKLAATEPHQQQQQQQQQKRRMTTERRIATFTDRIVACAEKYQHTDSVVVIRPTAAAPTPSPYESHHDRYPAATNEKNVKIVTNCDLLFRRLDDQQQQYRHDPTRDGAYLTTTTTTIHVQPLLVLDLNGILCHRIRTNREPPPSQRSWQYRPAAGLIANTSIIPRTDLAEFLTFVNQHFTLAIWTSAQRKTALQLVKLLLPPHVEERLLFIWAQPQCDRVDPPLVPSSAADMTSASYSSSSNSHSYYAPPVHHQQQQQQSHYQNHQPLPSPDPSKVLFLKDLSKVWKEFPLWNASNTLLMDDSPDKCPFFPHNALHPPPIHGRQPPSPPPPPPPPHQDHRRNHHHDRYGYYGQSGSSNSHGDYHRRFSYSQEDYSGSGNYYGNHARTNHGDYGHGNHGHYAQPNHGDYYAQPNRGDYYGKGKQGDSYGRGYQGDPQGPGNQGGYYGPGNQGSHYGGGNQGDYNHNQDSSSSNSNNNDDPMSDEENQSRQLDFFHRLVDFWKRYPTSQVIRGNDHAPDPTRRNDDLSRFLDNYASGHMGWMISSNPPRSE